MSTQVQPIAPWLNAPLLQESGTASTTALTTERKPVSRRRIPKRTDKTKISESKKRCIEVAAVYIEDAIHVRKPQTRIQEKGIDFKIWNRRIILSPLKAYKFVHNKWWKIFLYFVIWTHLLCVIWEPNNSRAKDLDDFNMINTWILAIQLSCLMIFILDCALKLFSHDREFLHNPWQRVLYFVITVNTIHVILTFMGHFIPQSLNLCLQIARPYYLVYNARSLRSVIRGVVRSVPRIMVLVWVIAFTVCCFGLIGYEMFWDVKDSNFNTFEDSMLSLMILLTTANYPDVMMPAYHSSQFAVIFFACFVVVILVLFLPTLLAVIYEGYHSQTQKRYSEITKVHKEALLRSFELLTCENDSKLLFASMSESFATNGMRSSLVVTKDIWMQFMRIIRPDLDAIKQEVLYTTLRLTEEDLSCLPSVVEYKLNSPETADGITQQQFLRLPEFIEIKFRISHKAGIAHELVALQSKLRPMGALTFGSLLSSYETRLRVHLLYIFSHPASEALIDWMVWVNALTFIAEKCANDLYSDYNGIIIFSGIHATFLVIFILEIILKIYAFGLRAFLSDTFFIFDTILVVSGTIGWIRSNDSDSYVQLIRALRLVRVVKEFPQMRLLVLFLSSLLRSFVILLLAQFCVFYVFAMVGMAMFDGLLGYDEIKREMAKFKPTDSDYIFWYNHLDHPDAAQKYYYLNNMNSFINSMIVLMELSVVNNWQVVMAMYIKMSGNHYNRIFFIAFYFCSVIVVLNVVIAFVINLFLVNYGQNISSNDLLFRYKRYIIMSILIHQLNDNEYDIYHWTIQRRIRPALWYQIIFEDNVNSSIENVNAAQMIGQGEIDDSIDYDDAMQMPFAQGTLIEQFQSFSTGEISATRPAAFTPKMDIPEKFWGTPEKFWGTPEKNIFLNQSLTTLDIALFSSLQSTYHPPQQHKHMTLSSRHKP